MVKKDLPRRSTHTDHKKIIRDLVIVTREAERPFIDLFRHEPENILQKPLGTLFGFFLLTTRDQSCAYIVNHLASFMRKEYFARTKRPPTESFDLALRRLNIALGELATRGTTAWMGHLHGALCVVERDMLHFSVCGNARIFLVRDGDLIPLSGDMTSPNEKNPLLTFQEVASGWLEVNDTVIVAPPTLGDTMDDIALAKTIRRIPRGGIAQFLHTVLINHATAAAGFTLQ